MERDGLQEGSTGFSGDVVDLLRGGGYVIVCIC